MKFLHLPLGIALCAVALNAQAEMSQYDQNTPFGWACCTSLTQGDDYSMTGGGTSDKSITLTSDGSTDMKSNIVSAINNYDVIKFDGSKNTDFIISSSIELEGVKNKTFVGINGARLCTQFYVTDEIKAKLDSADVNNLSSSGSGFTLSNGEIVDEQREATTRQILIKMGYGDDEPYIKAGIFRLKGCENLIFRNIKFVGPGPIDVGGYDLISILDGTTHVWVDHCEFTDGIDGNLDITLKADFVTVSWTTFSYTSRAYNHMYTNLIGGDDTASKQGEDNLNVTWAYCVWGDGCQQRMPMARFGTIHIFNCHYCSSSVSKAINPRKNSEFLVESNYFDSAFTSNVFEIKDAKAYEWKNNKFESGHSPTTSGSVAVPYDYSDFIFNTDEVPTELAWGNAKYGAGATLDKPLLMGTKPLSNNATLSNLAINGVKIPLVDGIVSYSYALPTGTTSLDITDITATPAHSKATYQVTVPDINNLPGDVVIVVTAEDGTTLQTYTVGLSWEVDLGNTSSGESKTWIVDNWTDYSGEPSSDFTVDGLTVHATSDKKVQFSTEAKTFSDNNSFSKYLDLTGRGTTTYRSISFAANAGDIVTIYSNAGERSRTLAISDGSNQLYSESNDMLTYTFTQSGTFYVYSTKGGIRIYAVKLESSSGYTTTLTPANGAKDVLISDTKALTMEFSKEIASYDLSKISYSPMMDMGELVVAETSTYATGNYSLVLTPANSWNSGMLYYATQYTIYVEEGAVTFTDGTTNNGFEWTFTTESLPSGLENITPDSRLAYNGNYVTTGSDARIEVYNIQGMRVAEGRRALDISHLNRGIYIVRCGNEIIKVAKR